ncbi:probable protein phosphatase 2C 55 [Olea europaea var. sylvestris]|uniref:probable protein phosphatase 2C 55 n=1 Tax=Olea europaea var. sylvestris TaxID=158386 RepID=UPI000C1D5E3C|nr:probable protein phosphatase 2C 55 [Olea europaea var. sylvestris]
MVAMDWSEEYRSILFDDQETVSCTESNLKMIPAAFYIPKDNPLRPKGEDAYFISESEQTIGVADGVGGWAIRGIDAGVYARELMSNVQDSVQDEKKKNGVVNPKRALTEGFRYTVSQGSSTACIITLQGEFLHCANVGDSKFVLIRDGKVVFSSPIQTNAFNSPYQLGQESDSPSVAAEFKCRVEPWDVIVVGTDGLFDNVHETELETMVFQGLVEGTIPDLLAKEIADFALGKATDPFACTPFQIEAIQAGYEYLGGKYDDITVVVAFIRPLA